MIRLKANLNVVRVTDVPISPVDGSGEGRGDKGVQLDPWAPIDIGLAILGAAVAGVCCEVITANDIGTSVGSSGVRLFVWEAVAMGNTVRSRSVL